jgi:DNA-directed RNA polymerase subunit H (RpoH/RPB5)
MFEAILKRLFKLRGYELNEPSVRTMATEILIAADLEEFLQQGCEPGVNKLIVVCGTNRVPSKKISFYQSLCDLDVFEESQLDLLLTGHRLIPEHKKLDDETAAEICEKYGEQNLPSLCISDPICKLNDFKLGDIIKITRARGIYFRRVVKD